MEVSDSRIVIQDSDKRLVAAKQGRGWVRKGYISSLGLADANYSTYRMDEQGLTV